MRYSLKSYSWKEIDFPMEERALISFSYDSVAINTNGAFHWLTWLPNKVSILIFNLFSEKLMLFDIPVQPSKEQRRGTYLQVLNGKLCFSLNSGYSVDIWVWWSMGKATIGIKFMDWILPRLIHSHWQYIDPYWFLKMTGNSYWKRALVWKQNFYGMT